MRWALVAIVLALSAPGCVRRQWRAEFFGPDVARVPAAPFVAVHLRDGELYVLRSIEIDPYTGIVRGEGIHYGFDRERLGEGTFEIPLDQISLFETLEPRVAARAPRDRGRA